jgi:transcriptional regulator of acetoin/glycerol metabolism
VRELSHAIEHAVFLGGDPVVGVGDLPPAIRGAIAVGRGGGDEDGAVSLKRALEHPERRLILEALERHGWRRDAAARALGINRTTLYKKLRRLGIGLDELQRSR